MRGSTVRFGRHAAAWTLSLVMASGALAVGVSAPRAAASDFITFTSLSPELALKAAQGALAACRKAGYQAAVVVVDRSGLPQVLLRDSLAGPHTGDTARRKAWTAATFKSATKDLISVTGPGMPQAGLRQVPGAMLLGGGRMIEKDGALIGAIGVSGAPGGDADDMCAAAGIASIEEDLVF